ncbi:MAG: hypothetical protein OER95_04885 [Acidimicrobiia bacterium]|nr:hypothetical protein [Acidimicrobiia bacterium]
MSDSTIRDDRTADQPPIEVDDLDHLAAGSGRSALGPDRRSAEPRSLPALRQELDEARLQLLTAVDAVAGAEAEHSAAIARIRELEHQHHMLEVERDELRLELERLSARRQGLTPPLFGRLVSGVRRVSRLRKARHGPA